MPRSTEDLTGKRFGRLKVLERDRSRTGGHACWLVICLPDYGGCGNTKSVGSNALRTGLTRSCGCLHREITVARNTGTEPKPAAVRGAPYGPKPRPTTRTKRYKATYQCWYAMIRRCTDPEDPAWDCYGGRGIGVCDRWRDDFSAFLADMGEQPEGLTLERKKNHLGYSPGNCCWASYAEQNRNTRRTTLTPAAIRKIRQMQPGGHTVAAIARASGADYRAVGAVLTIYAFLDANPAEVLADIAGIPEDTAQAILLTVAVAREDGTGPPRR